MIKVENIDFHGFDLAVRAMRNPMNSWNKSDSSFCRSLRDCCDCRYSMACSGFVPGKSFYIGQNDLKLMQKLTAAGVEHRTFSRLILCSMDITAPLYWWKEADRYRFKEQVSTSTMHKIAAKEFEMDDFSHEHLDAHSADWLKTIVALLNVNRLTYLQSKEKDDWWQIIQLLPSSYNQKRTIMMSYETCMKIIKERKDHKLDEWRELVSILERLPYMYEILGDAS